MIRPPPRLFSRSGIIVPSVLSAFLFASCSGAADAEADATMDLGRLVFTEASEPECSICHTLRDADATGKIGPDLDELKPEMSRIVAAVTNGVGVMPAQSGTLSEEQIRAVAFYVSQVAGRSE